MREDEFRKIIDINRELISALSKYDDNTLMIVNKKGIVEFAGEKISETCGVEPKWLVGKNVYELEGDKVFYPSVSVKVLECGETHSLIQKTRAGAELITVGLPIFNEKNEIEKVVSVTRDFTSELAAVKRIAELDTIVDLQNTEETAETVDMVTCSSAMFEIKAVAGMVAPTKATVLINGETGTGKEVLARYIYSLSDRKNKPFIKVNCGTISTSLAESELFGYEAGAFTGASREGKKGLVEAANGGTLFLDEISELPLDQQVKLLHVMQERKIIKVGGTRSIDLDVRIVAATNKNLLKEVAAGRFREDLFYRLNVIPINLPPLRKRKEDIRILVNFFLARFCEAYGKNIQVSKKAFDILEEYDWPGNIRQLENTIERLVLTTHGDLVSKESLPDELTARQDAGDISMNFGRVMRLDDAVMYVEKELISRAMREYGTTTKAAEALGVNQSTVSRKMAQYAIKVETKPRD